jgi:hypothetical protein
VRQGVFALSSWKTNCCVVHNTRNISAEAVLVPAAGKQHTLLAAGL